MPSASSTSGPQGHPEGLGNLPRAGAVVACRAVDQQDARRRGRGPSGGHRRRPRIARCLPFHRQLVVRIGEAGAGLDLSPGPCARPRSCSQAVCSTAATAAGNVLEGGVHEGARENQMEFIAAQLGGRLAFACGGHLVFLVILRTSMREGQAHYVRHEPGKTCYQHEKRRAGPKSAPAFAGERAPGLLGDSRWRRRRSRRRRRPNG